MFIKNTPLHQNLLQRKNKKKNTWHVIKTYSTLALAFCLNNVVKIKEFFRKFRRSQQIPAKMKWGVQL